MKARYRFSLPWSPLLASTLWFMLAMLGTATRLAAADIAILDGELMTREQLGRELDLEPEQTEDLSTQAAGRTQMLDQAINNRLLAKVALQKNLDKTKAFEERLAQARTRVLAQIYMQQYLEENTQDAQLLAYFNKHKTHFSNREVRVAHILLADEISARSVLKEALQNQADFSALARQYSTGSSAGKGGDLGFFDRGYMEASFEEAAFQTAAGSVYPGIVRTRLGFHVLKVLATRGSDQVRFEDVKETIREELRQELQKQLTTSLRNQAKLQILDETYKPTP